MIKFLHCNECGKYVSTGFEPVPTDTPDKGLILRAYVICPECMKMKIRFVKDDKTTSV